MNCTKTDLLHIYTKYKCYFLIGCIPNNCPTVLSITKQRNYKSADIVNAGKYLYEIFGATNRTMIMCVAGQQRSYNALISLVASNHTFIGRRNSEER